jgi:putative MATE family efflux protein
VWPFPIDAVYTVRITPRGRSGTDRDLTTGSISRNIWHLALPLMISGALLDIFSIVDMIFVGRLGPQAIAAVSIGGVIIGMVRMVGMGISIGTVALISRFVGQDDRETAKTVLGQSILLSVASGAVIGVLGYMLAEPVLRLLGAASDVIPYGVDYLRVMSVGSVAMFLNVVLGAGLRGFGNAKTPMIALGIGSVLNIGLDPLLIFGLGPFPRLEVAGSAIATVLTQAISAAILLVFLARQDGGIRLVATRANGDERFFARIMKIGSFSALRMLSMNVSRLVLVRIVATFGTYAVAAFGIGMRLRIFVLILGFGLADAAGVNVGQNLGAGRPDRAEKSAWVSVGFFAVFLVFVSAVFLSLPGAIIGVFNTHPEVIRLGTSFLLFFVPSLFFLDLAIVLGRALDGAGSTRVPMITTFVSLVVLGIPMAWGFSVLWGVNGLWASLVASNMVQGLLILVWFRMGRWKHQSV